MSERIGILHCFYSKGDAQGAVSANTERIEIPLQLNAKGHGENGDFFQKMHLTKIHCNLEYPCGPSASY